MAIKKTKAAGQIPQDEHLYQGNCKKVMSGVLVAPTSLITADTSSAARFVGAGCLLRVRVAAATFLAFGDSTLGAVSSSTATGIELNDAGTYLIVAAADYVRTSANVARMEVIAP